MMNRRWQILKRARKIASIASCERTTNIQRKKYYGIAFMITYRQHQEMKTNKVRMYFFKKQRFEIGTG